MTAVRIQVKPSACLFPLALIHLITVVCISENTVISQFKMNGMWGTTFLMHMNFRKTVSGMLDAFLGSDLNQVVQSIFCCTP